MLIIRIKVTYLLCLAYLVLFLTSWCSLTRAFYNSRVTAYWELLHQFIALTNIIRFSNVPAICVFKFSFKLFTCFWHMVQMVVLFLQVIYGLLFTLVIALISDALSALPDKVSVLSHDASFRHDFHQNVSWKVISVFTQVFVCCFLITLCVR